MPSLVWEGSRALRMGWSVINSREVLPTREGSHAESLSRGRRGNEVIKTSYCLSELWLLRRRNYPAGVLSKGKKARQI